MSTEVNKEQIRRAFDEFINKGNVDSAGQYLAPDYVGYFPGFPPVKGIAAFQKFIKMWTGAFSDRQVTVDEIVAEGDLACIRTTFRGTHTGDLNGIPPTGRRVTISAIDMFRMVDGRAAEQHANSDDLAMLHQLGLMPSGH